MKTIVLFLTISLPTLAQNMLREKTDTIFATTGICLTFQLKLCDYSASAPAQIFVTNSNNFKTLKKLIPKYYYARKQEYCEYYILGVPCLKQNKINDQILIEFLNKIDSSRVLRGVSTFRQLYTWDTLKNKIDYQIAKKKISQIDNLYFLKTVTDVCKYMSCPIKRSYSITRTLK